MGTGAAMLELNSYLPPGKCTISAYHALCQFFTHHVSRITFHFPCIAQFPIGVSFPGGPAELMS